MKKRIGLILLTIFCAFNVCACGLGEKNDIRTNSQTKTSKGTEKASTIVKKLSDDLYSFQVSIDGTVVQVPTWVSDFETLGFTCEEDLSQKLYPDEEKFVSWYKDDYDVYTVIKNPGINTASYADCVIEEISVYEEEGIKVKFPGGIQLGEATVEDVVEAHGAPSDAEDDEISYDMYYWLVESEKEIRLSFDAETEKLDNISIQNTAELEGMNNEVSKEVPKEVTAYKAPEALGSDMLSGNIELEGKLYTLPCPLSEFLENGFILNMRHTPSVVAGKASDSVEMRYGNASNTFEIINFSEDATTPENCFVTTVKVSKEYKNFNLTLPKASIKVGESEETLLEALEGCHYVKVNDHTYGVCEDTEDYSYERCIEIHVYDGVIESINVCNEVMQGAE